MKFNIACVTVSAIVPFILLPLEAAVAQNGPTVGTTCTKRFADPEPRGMSNWITADDYPQRALREERQGKVRYRVNVAITGRVENVEILESNGDDLASATMKILTRRARFTPAMRDCQPVPGEYEGALNWTLPG